MVSVVAPRKGADGVPADRGANYAPLWCPDASCGGDQRSARQGEPVWVFPHADFGTNPGGLCGGARGFAPGETIDQPLLPLGGIREAAKRRRLAPVVAPPFHQ